MGFKPEFLFLCSLWACGFIPLKVFSQTEPTKHVISLNLCTDQLLVSLLPAHEIAALSPLASDCSESVICRQARSIPLIKAEGEAVLNHNPTHILESQWNHPTIQKIAQLRSIPYYKLPLTQKLDDIPEHIRALSAWLGVPEKGESLAQQFEQDKKALQLHNLTHPLRAAFYSDNDDPLLENIIKDAGFLSLAGTQDHYRVFSPEALLLNPPDLLVITKLNEGKSLKETKLLPSFLLHYFGKAHFMIIPMKLTLCGSPYSLEALKLLRKAHLTLIRGKE